MIKMVLNTMKNYIRQHGIFPFIAGVMLIALLVFGVRFCQTMEVIGSM